MIFVKGQPQNHKKRKLGIRSNFCSKRKLNKLTDSSSSSLTKPTQNDHVDHHPEATLPSTPTQNSTPKTSTQNTIPSTLPHKSSSTPKTSIISTKNMKGTYVDQDKMRCTIEMVF